MSYAKHDDRVVRAQKLIAKLEPVLDSVPCPMPADAYEEPYRVLSCPSYDACIAVAATANWCNMTCSDCPVAKKYGKDIEQHARRRGLEEVVARRLDPLRAVRQKRSRMGRSMVPTPAIASLMLVCFFWGCATTPPPEPTVTIGKRVEDQPLPPDPASEPLPDGTPKGEWAEPLEKGACVKADGTVSKDVVKPCPARSGVSISEEKATRLALFKIRYPELRLNYQADRQVWKAHRELYETRLQLAADRIKELQPGWFQRHKFEIGIAAGFLVGAAITISVFEVADQLSK